MCGVRKILAIDFFMLKVLDGLLRDDDSKFNTVYRGVLREGCFVGMLRWDWLIGLSGWYYVFFVGN